MRRYCEQSASLLDTHLTHVLIMCLVDGHVISTIQHLDVNIYMEALQTIFACFNIVWHMWHMKSAFLCTPPIWRVLHFWLLTLFVLFTAPVMFYHSLKVERSLMGCCFALCFQRDTYCNHWRSANICIPSHGEKHVSWPYMAHNIYVYILLLTTESGYENMLSVD